MLYMFNMFKTNLSFQLNCNKLKTSMYIRYESRLSQRKFLPCSSVNKIHYFNKKYHA